MLRQICFPLHPFNEAQYYTKGTEYLSCFHSSLFMFLNSRGKCIDKYIANYIFYYGYCPHELDLRYRYEIRTLSCQNLHKLYQKSNIDVRSKCIEPSEVINYICKCIDNNIPVMAKVDLYFLSYRPDRFMKIHTNHYITIYGCDLEQKRLNIIDNPENQEYFHCLVHQDEFLKAFQSAYKWQESNLFEFEDLGNEIIKYSNKECIKIFENNIKNSKKKI